MNFIFSLFFAPVILIGLVMSVKDLYFYLANHPKLSRGKAGVVAFFFAGISSALLAVPHVFTAALGAFNYVVAAVTALFIIVGLWHAWKWGKLIIAVEDNDPSNDPTVGKGTTGGDATKGDPDKK